MAAMDYPEILFFASKWHQMVEKDVYEDKLCVLSM